MTLVLTPVCSVRQNFHSGHLCPLTVACLYSLTNLYRQFRRKSAVLTRMACRHWHTTESLTRLCSCAVAQVAPPTVIKQPTIRQSIGHVLSN